VSGGPSYDANGNQLSSTGLSSISWNAYGQAVSVSAIANEPYTGTYDAAGRLVEITLPSGGTQQFVYSPSGAKIAVVQQAQPGGPLVKGTVSLPGGDTAIYNFSGLSYLRHTDWLGSSRLATTWNHGVYSKESYAPFGETYNEQANTSGGPDRSFTGQDQDVVTGSQGTGIYEFMFRKYDPAAGRWLSPDPMGWGSASLENPQSLNRYAYVMNSPLSNVDPNGLECVWDDGSYDSNNDPETGAVDANGQHSNCTSAGGTWVDHSNFDGMPDWCSDQDADAGTCGYDTSLSNALFDPNAPNNGTPLTPEQLHKQQQTKLNQKCAAATASSAALATTAGMNEGAALLTGEITPFAAIFHGIAVVEGIGAGGVGIYAAFACYNAAQF
jgi:RHS repeat-associated protein